MTIPFKGSNFIQKLCPKFEEFGRFFNALILGCFEVETYQIFSHNTSFFVQNRNHIAHTNFWPFVGLGTPYDFFEPFANHWFYQ